jgi:small subunit ribosomal protein S17
MVYPSPYKGLDLLPACSAMQEKEWNLNMQDRKLKTVTGLVISNSGNKSIKIAVDFKVRHPKYGKYIRHRTKLAVHDERNQAGVGDVVEVIESRPYSKTKSWRLVKVLEKAVQMQ